jgi:hypothetical protein
VTGAGAGGYFGTGAPASLEVGAAWDARVTFGTRSIIALEAGYVGATNNIEMTPAQSGTLNSNGFDTDFRLQAPYWVQPYVFTGVGYNHMSVSTNGNAAIYTQMNASDNEVTVPAGGGVTMYLGKNRHATIDARATYRFIGDNNLTVTTNAALHQWVAQARVGYAF